MGVTYIAPAGTVTSPAKLITKNITDNGTYDAADDLANGYSRVVVNVEGGGGSSDFSTAEVTVVNNSGETKTLFDIFATTLTLMANFAVFDPLMEIPNGETIVISIIIPTNQSYLGGALPPAVATNLINCEIDDGDIIITNISEDASLTITIS